MVLISGCVTQHDLEYMQTRNINNIAYSEAKVPDYKLKPNDELYIQIKSLDDPLANVFSNAGSQQSSNAMSTTPYGASLESYSVNKEGYLQLSILGNIFVNNKTLAEVSVILTDSLSHILSQPIVTVKLVNRYVSVLGYVGSPGHFPYSQEKLTIFDALGLAGDISVYGNRKEVTLTRNENGKNINVNIDLTKPAVLGSDYYYIRPNDIIYVKPLRKRFWGMSEFPFAILLSTFSVTLLFYSVIK